MSIPVEIEKQNEVHRISLPSKWAGLTLARWRAIMLYIILTGRPRGYEQIRRQLHKLLRVLADGDVKALDDLDVISLGDISTALMWTSKVPDHIESYFTKWGPWRGPKKGLSDTVVKEYLLVSQYMHLWANACKNKNEKLMTKALNGVWAAGMRWRFFGYSDRLADVTMVFARFVPRDKKMMHLYNWWGLLTWLRWKYPEVFDQDDDGDGVAGPRALIVSIAGEKFGPVKKVNGQNIHDIMTYLQISAKQAAKMKEK